jgi:photosynthetic reaction center cytochrome c subunit
MRKRHRPAVIVVSAIAVAALLSACEPPPVNSVQRGFRGTAMAEVYHPASVAAAAALNAAPPVSPPASPDGAKASQVFKNVKVLGDLSAGQFAQMMVDMTAWVAPQQGCTFCHVVTDFADDSLYPKVVSRRMLQMTQHINADWKSHVVATGVTCYTCHRGNNVPANIWFRSPEPAHPPGMLGNRAGQNAPAMQVGLTSLPNDPFSAYVGGSDEIRVVATTALPSNGRPSMIKRTEATYGLMIHMSKALGVNCTYCHNTRSFASWESSTPQRTTAFYGIRMARDLNANYLASLAGVFPPNRLGPTGDVPKLNCATCHQGAYKPLYGANILNDHPGLVAVSMAAAGDEASVVVENGIVKFYFATGKADIGANAAGPLAEISRQVAGGGSAVVSGFNDPTGEPAKNEELAKQRAFAVRDALKSAGVADDRIRLKKPESTMGTGSNAEARRVEVSVAK